MALFYCLALIGSIFFLSVDAKWNAGLIIEFRYLSVIYMWRGGNLIKSLTAITRLSIAFLGGVVLFGFSLVDRLSYKKNQHEIHFHVSLDFLEFQKWKLIAWEYVFSEILLCWHN